MDSTRRLFIKSGLDVTERRPAVALSQAAPRPARRWSYQVLHTALGMGVFQVVSFLTGILIARGLGSERQGRFQLVLSVGIFTVTLAKMGLDEGVAYLIPKYQALKPKRVSALIAYSLGSTFFISLALGALFHAASGYLERYVFRLEGLAANLSFAVWLMPATMLMMMSVSVLRGLGRSHERAYVYYYLVGLSFLAFVAAFSASGLTATGAFVARTGSFALGAAVAIVLIVRAAGPGELRLGREELSELHRFSGLLVFVGLFQYVVEQPLVDLMIVGRVASAEEVGVYSVAARVGVLVAISANALNIALAPALASSISNGDAAKLAGQYARASEWMARLSLFTGIVLILARKEMLALFGSEYRAGEGMLVILLIGQIAAGLWGLNSPLLLASGNARTEFILTGIFAVVMISGGALMGRSFGATGVAFATASSAVLLAVARRIACARLLKRLDSASRLEKKMSGILLIGLIAGAGGYVAQEMMAGKGIAGTAASVGVFVCAFWLLSLKYGMRLDFSFTDRNGGEGI